MRRMSRLDHGSVEERSRRRLVSPPGLHRAARDTFPNGGRWHAPLAPERPASTGLGVGRSGASAKGAVSISPTDETSPDRGLGPGSHAMPAGHHIGGGWGIRTPEGVNPTRFPSV